MTILGRSGRRGMAPVGEGRPTARRIAASAAHPAAPADDPIRDSISMIPLLMPGHHQEACRERV
jgi:hypothetical protein